MNDLSKTGIKLVLKSVVVIHLNIMEQLCGSFPNVETQ
jgi:hypothetical protein